MPAGRLRGFKGQIGNGTLLSDISDKTVAEAVAKRRGQRAKRQGRNVTNATVNRTVTQPLRGILRRAGKIWKTQVQDIDWSQHMLDEAQEIVREATPDQEAALKAKMRPDYEPALRFALLTGCRRAEIVGLTWTAVDFFSKEFTVTGKRDRTRTIPMTRAVFDLLWSQKDFHDTAVFTYVAKRRRDGRIGERMPITMEGFKSEWRRARTRAKVTGFRFHDTRHTAATRLMRATGNLKMTQQLLGHTEIATTSRYAHVSKDDLRAGLEAASPTESPTKAKDQSAKA